MSDIRLIALDMDGTLVNSMKKVAPEELEALSLAFSQGIHVVAASGRTQHTLPAELLAMKELRYIISCNGAKVMDRLSGKAVYRRSISQADMLRIMEHAKSFRCVREVALDDSLYLACEDDEDELSFVPPHQHDFMRSARTLTDRLETMMQQAKDGAEKILIFFHRADELQAFRRWLEENFSLCITSSLDSNIEVNALGVSKGSALCALAEHLGIPMEQVMACGDSENDIEMLRAAGLGIAMANSTPEALAAADAVTLSNEEHGVAAAIKRYALHQYTI